MLDTEWRFAFASEIGTSHVRMGMPCQDASVCEIVTDASGAQVLVALASDGAGSAPKADEGASFACAMFFSLIAEWLSRNSIGDLTRDYFAEWLRSFLMAIEEKARACGAVAERDYACTILIAVIGPTNAAYFQIGDGAIVVKSPGDETRFDVVFWPQRGEYENTTNFATDPSSFGKRRCEVVRSRIQEVALFTDGLQALVLHYATKMAHSRYFDQMLTSVRRAAIAGKSGELCDALKAYLGSQAVNTRTDDDKTLILATRCAVQQVE